MPSENVFKTVPQGSKKRLRAGDFFWALKLFCWKVPDKDLCKMTCAIQAGASTDEFSYAAFWPLHVAHPLVRITNTRQARQGDRSQSRQNEQSRTRRTSIGCKDTPPHFSICLVPAYAAHCRKISAMRCDRPYSRS